MNVYRPRGRIWTAAPATVPVVSLPDMKAQLRVHHPDEDGDIVSFEAGAVALVERYLQRLLTPREVVLRLPGLPAGRVSVELPGGRVAQVTSVVAEGVTITGATAQGDSPARLFPTTDWPIVTAEGLPVVVTYTAGYATVPADIVTAVKLVVEALYSNDDRGPMTPAVEALLYRHRIKGL